MNSFLVHFSKICLVIFFLSAFLSFSQTDPKSIKVRKESSVYFFQKGEARDTISLNNGDLFYFLISDSLKGRFSLLIDNGQLLSYKGDTLLQLKYLEGLKYECAFDRKESGPIRKPKITWEFKTLINGTTDYESKKIRVLLYNKRKDKIMMENIFYYKQK